MAGDPARIAELTPAIVTKEAIGAAFATYADTHEPSSIRRCWSTWNTLCAFLYTSECIPSNPMPFVGRPKVPKSLPKGPMPLIGRPKVPKSLPKGLGTETVSGLLTAIDGDTNSRRKSDWSERDAALVLTAVLAGLRADELIRANAGDIRAVDGGGVIHVRGKGNKDRRIPVEEVLIRLIERYLESRAARFPGNTRRQQASAGTARWPATAALFVGGDGERITRGVLQYRVLRAFTKAGLNNQRARGALAHGLRHTYATELANSDVSVYALMKLLGQESMVTSQRYVDGAGAENRAAAVRNPLWPYPVWGSWGSRISESAR